MHSFPNNNNNKATSISRTYQGRVKTVYYNHTQPFRNERHKKDTALSSQLRKLKKKANEIPKLTWSILKIVPEYSNILKRCLLCHFYLSIYLSIHPYTDEYKFTIENKNEQKWTKKKTFTSIKALEDAWDKIKNY